MRLKRRVANFSIKNCGLRHLHGSKFSRLVRSVLDEIDLEHIRETNPCRTCLGREEMYDYVHESLVNQEAIDYLEFGVFRGDTIRYWAGLNQNKDSRFFGFDSFEGLPEYWRPGAPKGTFDVGGALPQIDDGRVTFIKGWFENTIPPFVREFSVKNRLLLHIDADLYSSAMLALVHLGPFMSPGTILIFDEFSYREHEFKALSDWQKIYKKNFRVIAEMANFAKICVELT